MGYSNRNKTNDQKIGQGREASKKYLKENPWVRCFLHINWRCNNHKCPAYRYYGGRGIKTYLKLEDVKFLWHRDKANKMKRPSIDRINNDGHYELSNCRFIEASENIKRNRPFSSKDIKKIRNAYFKEHRTQVELASRFGVRQTTISNIVLKKHYPEV